jgi:peptidoglycan/LPS O-acetylase OafA/YrhL
MSLEQKSRLDTLDSLRGLATLQVVAAHCLVALPALAWMVYEDAGVKKDGLAFFLAYSPFHIFWSATAAVLLFFVLSGFVLSLPWFENRKAAPSYPVYFIKRLFRLYLPCFVIIIISILGKYFLYDPSQVTEYGNWVKNTWSGPIGGGEIAGHIFLSNQYINNINPALWTLPIEIIVSLLLPFFLYALRRMNATWSIVTVLLYPFCFHLTNYWGASMLWEGFLVMYWVSFFLMGAILCKYRKLIMSRVDRLPLPIFIFFGFSCLLAYTYEYSLWFIPDAYIQKLHRVSHYIYAWAGAGFILIALSKRTFAFFSHPVLLYLGRLSFSLYLVHQVVIVILVHVLPGIIPHYLVIVISVFASLILAHQYAKLVEQPSARIAKRMGRYTAKNLSAISLRLRSGSFIPAWTIKSVAKIFTSKTAS